LIAGRLGTNKNATSTVSSDAQTIAVSSTSTPYFDFDKILMIISALHQLFITIMDGFYDPISNNSIPVTTGWVATTLGAASSPNVILALLLGPFIIVALTRYVSGIQIPDVAGDKNPWKVPYWFPFVGHAFSLWVVCNGDEVTQLIKTAVSGIQ
jgi:hypothetical protein